MSRSLSTAKVRKDLEAARARVRDLENLLEAMERAYPEEAPAVRVTGVGAVAGSVIAGMAAGVGAMDVMHRTMTYEDHLGLPASSGPVSAMAAIDGMVYVLKEADRPLTLDAMVDGMLANGWRTRGENPKETLRVAIRRDEGEKVVRVDRGLYGLPEWEVRQHSDPPMDEDVFQAMVDAETDREWEEFNRQR